MQRHIPPVILVLASLLLASAALNPPQTPQTVDAHYQKTCIDAQCHPAANAQTIPTHVPFLEGQCGACHLDHTAATPALLRPGGDQLCLGCHTTIEPAAAEASPHGADGRPCLDCHAPHQSRLNGLARSEEIQATCAACHTDFLAQSQAMPYRHKHFDPQGQCGQCHYAHLRAEQAYLRENVAESCLTCHDLPIAADGRTLENVARVLREKPVTHQPMHSRESCPTCHTPHGAMQPSLLKTGYPAGKYEAYRSGQYALCWECHDQRLVESPIGTAVTKFRDGPRNLHRLHVAELKRGRVCGLCHEPHASELPALLRQSTLFGEWRAPLIVELTPAGGSCQTPCHRQMGYERTARLDPGAP